jgi:replication factor C subunit 3/5
MLIYEYSNQEKGKETINTEKNTLLPWSEKYRPNSINNILYHDKIKLSIENYMKNKKLPHLLFYGPPGTGKTSTMIAYAKHYYNDDYNNMTLVLNASEERGIETVRTRIKQFVISNGLKENKNTPPFKLIILDEIDAMTEDAQAILRKVIEKYVNNARFCFICNYLKKINPAIQSRCVIFRFNPISYDMMYKFSVNICENEKIKIKKRALELVIKKSNGDLRKLLNYLQSLYMHNHHLISEKKEKVNLEEDVYIIIDEKSVSKILVCPTEKAIEDLLKYIKNNKLNDSIKYLTNLIEIKDISLLELINFIYEYCMDNLINNIKVVDYSKEKIVNIIKDLAIINENLTYCNNENIQLISLLSIFYKI